MLQYKIFSFFNLPVTEKKKHFNMSGWKIIVFEEEILKINETCFRSYRFQHTIFSDYKVFIKCFVTFMKQVENILLKFC